MIANSKNIPVFATSNLNQLPKVSNDFRTTIKIIDLNSEDKGKLFELRLNLILILVRFLRRQFILCNIKYWAKSPLKGLCSAHFKPERHTMNIFITSLIERR